MWKRESERIEEVCEEKQGSIENSFWTKSILKGM